LPGGGHLARLGSLRGDILPGECLPPLCECRVKDRIVPKRNIGNGYVNAIPSNGSLFVPHDVDLRFGVYSLENATRNTRLVLDVAQAPPEVLVARGAARPLAHELVTAEIVHGADGLGNVTGVYPAPRHPLAEEEAADLLLEMIDRYGDTLTVIATAPMTNLALAARRDAAIFRRVGEIVQMGGAIRVPGNISPLAEYNLYVDPEAAAEVVASGARLRLVPLDVTLQAALLRSELRRLAQERDSAVFQFVREITVLCMDAHQKFLGLNGIHLHDPAVVAALMNSGRFSAAQSRLAVVVSADPWKCGNT